MLTCRYGQHGPYKRHFACFHCRKAFKRSPVPFGPSVPTPNERGADGGADPAPCPECGRRMEDMGLDFKPPGKCEVEHWEVVEFLSAKDSTTVRAGAVAQDSGLPSGLKSRVLWPRTGAQAKGKRLRLSSSHVVCTSGRNASDAASVQDRRRDCCLPAEVLRVWFRPGQADPLSQVRPKSCPRPRHLMLFWSGFRGGRG